MALTIGIDLGTTNTCAAFVSNKIPRVIPAEAGYNTMPSTVSLQMDGSVLVGENAKESRVMAPQRTLVGIKRLFGRQFASPVVQALVDYFPYKIVADSDGEAAVEIDSKTHSCSELQSHILRHVKRYAEIQMGDDIPDVVIAVPAYFNDHQRTLVKKAGEIAGWNVRRVVNEPTAAALAYGFNRGFDQKILIYDLGGGTFDVSVLELTGNVFQVIATGGDMFLGGTDFDNRIVDWILESFRKQTKIDLSEEVHALQQVREAAERAKIELSILANTEIRLPGITERRGKMLDLQLVLDRSTLNDITHDLVEQTLKTVDRVLEEKGLSRSSINEVILVGGQTRMPLVVESITNHLGQSPRKGVHPDECVALGAALLADSLDQIDSVILLDALSIPIGIADPSGNLSVVIDKHTSLPTRESSSIPTTKDNQDSLQVEIYQGESGEPVSEAEYLGTLTYDKIPAAQAGQIQVHIEFSLDEEGMLSLKATDTATQTAPRELNLATIQRKVPERNVIDEKPAVGVNEPQPEGSAFKGFMKSFLGGKK